MRMVLRTRTNQGSKVPIDTQREIIQLYLDERLSIEVIARRVYWSVGTCHAVLERQGVERRPSGGRKGPRPIDQDILDRTVELYASGLSCEEIGAVMGVGHTTVGHRLRREGVQLRTQAKGSSIRRTKDLSAHRLATLEAIKEYGPITANDIGARVGRPGRHIRDDVRRLRLLNLIEPVKEPVTHKGQRYVRTGLTLPELAARLAGLPVEDEVAVMVDTGPFLAWLEDFKRRNPDVVPARRFGMDEAILRRIGRQKRMTLELADTILTRSRDHVFLWELWPELYGDPGAREPRPQPRRPQPYKPRPSSPRTIEEYQARRKARRAERRAAA